MLEDDIHQFLKNHGLRTTRPRVSVARCLFGGEGDRHVTAEQLAEELRTAGEEMALATVYNTLHHFVAAGLLRELAGTGRGKIIFDTNVSAHHHLYNETTGELTDIPHDVVTVDEADVLPEGAELAGCDVIIRIR